MEICQKKNLRDEKMKHNKGYDFSGYFRGEITPKCPKENRIPVTVVPVRMPLPSVSHPRITVVKRDFDHYEEDDRCDHHESESEESEDECDFCGDLEVKSFNKIGITGQLGCDVCMCVHNDTSACSRAGCITGDCKRC